MKDNFVNMPCHRYRSFDATFIGNLGNSNKEIPYSFGDFSHYFREEDDTYSISWIIADLGFSTNCKIYHDSITLRVPNYNDSVGIVYHNAIQHLREGTLLLRNCPFVGMLVDGYESFLKIESMALPFGVTCIGNQFHFTFENEADFVEASLKW